MTQQNNGFLFNRDIPALPMGDSEGKTWVAFWQAQAEWTAKVADTNAPTKDDETEAANRAIYFRSEGGSR
jgi:hypothetical protein